MKLKYIIPILAVAIVASCKKTEKKYDASGSFEAEETIISAEAAGTLKEFNLSESEELKTGQLIGYIDSTQLYLKKKQLLASINAVLSKRPDVALQLGALDEQLKTADKEKQRMTSLVSSGAGTQKQLDDVLAQINVINKQKEALQSSLKITVNGITQETQPLYVQIEQLNDQLTKCRIINPVNGTVLAKYVEPNEVAAPGKPLYKIADLSEIILRAYISGSQLSQVKLGQQLKVFVDDGAENYKEYAGEIIWISDKAEFTPKTIMTKDERSNLVYAVKIKVKNDGFLKLGMYGEVTF
jgi:HlyD family secretion protein